MEPDKQPTEEANNTTAPTEEMGTPINDQPTGLGEVTAESKRSKKQLILIVVAFVVLLAASAVAAWYLLKPAAAPAQTASKTTPKPEVKAPESLYMQLEQTITAFDPVTQKSTVVTSDVPENSMVIDFYRASDTEWRYYAYDQLANKVYYADQSTDPTAVPVDTKLFEPVANAKKKMYAYALIGDFEGKQQTQTYLSKDNAKPELIYESSGKAVSAPKVTSYLFLPRAISANGDEVLFQQARCFQCDGGNSSNLFVLTLATKEAEIINTSSDIANKASFTSGGDVLLTNGVFSYSWNPTNKVDIHTYVIKNGNSTELYKSSGATESYAVSADGEYVLTRVVGKDYPATEDVNMGKLYTRSGEAWNAESTDVGSYTSPDDYDLGKESGDCVAASFYKRTFPSNKSTGYDYSVGAFCKDEDGTYTYQQVAGKKYTVNNEDSWADFFYGLL